MGQCNSKRQECPICIQPIYYNQYNAPCCNCSFHKHCYMKWFISKKTCPWCRYSENNHTKMSNVQIYIIQQLRDIENNVNNDAIDAIDANHAIDANEPSISAIHAQVV